MQHERTYNTTVIIIYHVQRATLAVDTNSLRLKYLLPTVPSRVKSSKENGLGIASQRVAKEISDHTLSNTTLHTYTGVHIIMCQSVSIHIVLLYSPLSLFLISKCGRQTPISCLPPPLSLSLFLSLFTTFLGLSLCLSICLLHGPHSLSLITNI